MIKVVVLLVLFLLIDNPHAQTHSMFITRIGSQLIQDGAPFRFAGANMHWLGLLDNGTYPTFAQIDQVFTDAKAMGFTVVRAHTLGVSLGCPNCVEPTLNQFNPLAFRTIDYAIQKARANGIYLVIPLTDNWHYYHGGKHTFTDWRGISNEDAFYTNSSVISDFRAYVAHLILHVNQFTGIALKDDPTILGWESGNELISEPSAWVESLAQYVKSIDPNHLFVDGRQGQVYIDGKQEQEDTFVHLDPEHLANPSVDIYQGHSYPPDAPWAITDALAAKEYGKVYIVGEYAWNNLGGSGYGGTPLTAFLSAIESTDNNISGDLLWDMYPADLMGDQYTFHYPGDTQDMRDRATQLVSHAASMSD